MINENSIANAKRFHSLHNGPSTFVLPNAWDVMSAKMFEECGFEAIGTTSAGIAMSLGYPDGEELPLEKMVTVLENIVKSVNVPVSADIEAGYGKTTKEVLHTVKQVISVGVAGINLEDGTGDKTSPIFDSLVQQEKIAAIREYCDSIGFPLFINARTDVYWLNLGDPSTRIEDAIHRAKLFQEAGADCVFIPRLIEIEDIQRLRQEISCPINLLAVPGLPSLPDLSKMGIERVSTGSSPFRATLTLLKDIGEDISGEGTFQRMTNNVLTYNQVSNLI